MRKEKVIFCCVLSLFFCRSFCQQQSLKDSIEKRYLNNGAWHYSYFSNEWQKNIDSGLAIVPGDAMLWQQKAMPYFKCRKYEVGLQFLDKAVALDPKEYLSYRGFINCIFAKRFYNAIADLKEAEALNGNRTEMEHPYSFYIAISYLQLNKFDSALFYLNKTIAVESPEGRTAMVHFMDLFYLGIVNYELQNYTTSIEYFDKALARYGRFSEAKFYKAICLNKLHIKKEESARLFEEANTDFKSGYTFTEDNCVYEKYPYQLSDYIVKYHGGGM